MSAVVCVPIALVLAVGLFFRTTVFSGDRVRRLRWRIRLHLHPGPGFATVAELWCRWSRHAAIGHGRRARPGMRFRHRLRARTTDYAVRLGRGQWLRRAYARLEDQVLICAAPRTGKSGMVADRILDHPGPVLVTSTRADLYESTAGARFRRGPVHVFNPQGVGGITSTLKWDLLGPCRDLVMARRMASWLKVPGVSGDLRWFEAKGDVALAALLWAAAVTGRTILDVYEWVQLHDHATCLQILAEHPGGTRQMFAVVKRMFEENRTSGSIRDTIDLTLSWAILPGLAEAVTPPPGQGFSAADFTTSCGALYLIASGDDDSPLTPVCRALASWVHYEAGLAGSMQAHNRLDPPLLMALDEVTQVCPVDLPVMLSDSAGKGVLMTAVCHSVSQLEERWGKHGADTIWSTCGTKILLGGISDPDTLERTSKLCGTVRNSDGNDPVVPPELLRMLPDWRALVLRMNLSPAVVKVRPAWHRLSYRLGLRPLPLRAWAPAPGLPDLRIPEPEAAAVDVPEFAPAANGHGGQPGDLTGAGW
ncbi:MAG: type IV secretory system conjugative DNA transfer family protein [Streptosporangiaceae bacterium]